MQAPKPLPPPYPRRLITIGDHVLKRRLDLKLTQKQAAQMIGTNEWSIIDWEFRKQGVSLEAMPKVVNFLGYIPYDLTKMSLGEQISTCRKINGLTQEKLASKLNVYIGAIVDWEKNRRLPSASCLEAMNSLFATILPVT